MEDVALGFAGYVVETRADEFFAVFERPQTAIDAAVAIQRELRGRTWLDDLEVRIRIGIHSGNSDPERGELHRHGRPHDGTHLCGWPTVGRSSCPAARGRRRADRARTA